MITRVATAGSCFAQHISRYLQKSDFHYYVAEPGHPILPEAHRLANNYGVFSARYGNIYTARQLRQLIERAYGIFCPVEGSWQVSDGVFVDPFRPSAQPGGFISDFELQLDREQHLASVRTLFETLDIFIFTLGLTECWVSRADGAAFPVCPGVAGGSFDEARYSFINQTVDDVVTDMAVFLDNLSRVNPSAEVILTVSPVPLAATARADQHVLAATTYSKAVLRVATEMLASSYSNISYFPSYEVITASFSRGSYYAGDLRNVLETGVSHVMRLFMKHACAESHPGRGANVNNSVWADADGDNYEKIAANLVQVECDEAALDRH